MANLTGGAIEALYLSTVASAAKASFTTEANLNDTATMGARPVLPANAFMPSGPMAGAKGLKILAHGILSSTATPTYTFSLRLGSNGNITTAAIILGSAALTTGSGVSNQIWRFEGVVTFKALAGDVGANSTVTGVGTLISSGTANKIDPLYGAAASPGTVATVDLSIANYFNFNITCSASSPSNTITLQQLNVFWLG